MSLGLLVSLFASGTTILLGGDLMLNSIPVRSLPLQGLTEVGRRADVFVANLEVPLTRSQTGTTLKSAEEVRRRSQYILKADPEHAAGLRTAGMNLVSLGNNHAMDYGWTGVEDTFSALQREGIAFAGAGSRLAAALEPVVLRTRSGLRVSMVSALAFVTTEAMRKCGAATGDRPGIAVLDLGGVVQRPTRERLLRWVGAAKSQSDLVIVSVHWGWERETMPTPYQVALGRALVDAGADVVLGHHPHVLQGAEWYRGKPILYSMGNLVSALPGRTGLVRLTVSQARGIEAEFLPADIFGGRVTWTPAPQVAARDDAFRSLCRALIQKYPNPDSRPLFEPKRP
jgi:poly-gamma-glutamate capsule biosynthesis protein CapA/YwtB (metallophosphatase superfamily)